MIPEQPNIILVNCDDLGYGDLGCYGSQVHHTPVLDRMAEEGARFTDFYMASPVCSPSRGAMLTGCYPRRIGFDTFDGRAVLGPGHAMGLHPDEITIARALKDAGYATMLVGKWHCGDQAPFLPTKHGFDHYFGIPYSNDMGRQVPRLHAPPLPLMVDDEVIQEQPDQTSLTERYTEHAVRFIRGHKDRPFFLYFAHMYVHLPLYVPERFMKDSQNGKYGGAVAHIDWVMGVLLHEVRRLGLEEKTLIVFTSDNGSRCDNEGSNGPLRGRKTQTWEGGMRVPCIMYWPGVIPKGRVVRELTTGMDFFPTFVSLGGGKLPEDRNIDGYDIRPLMFGEEGAASPYEAFFYYWQSNIEAVRAGKWKLHVRKRDQEVKELYDLEQDIGERTNLYDAFPDVVKQLEKLLEQGRNELGDGATGAPGRNLRPAGRVEDPRPLTYFDETHPYFVAHYDLNESG